MLGIDLSGRVAIVTGGSRGIGSAISSTLAAAGAKVMINHLGNSDAARTNAADLVHRIASTGADAGALAGDVSQITEMQRLVDETVTRFGSPSIIVANAGTTSRHSFGGLSVDEWRRIIDVNLNGVFNLVRSALPHLVREGSGKIVIVGSAAVVAGGGGGAHYAASKSALEGFTRALARELAPNRVNVNLIHPSLIATDLLVERHPEEKTRRELALQVPLGRLGRPEDIGSLAAFLCSELASYITGQFIFVDGGRTFLR